MAFVRDEETNDIKSYRKFASKAARDLHYDSETIIKIKKAKTIGEIERIMGAARHQK